MTLAVDSCLKPAAPKRLSPRTHVLSLNPFPLQAAVPIGLSPPRTLDPPVLRILTSLHPHPPVYQSVVPREPSDCPCFTACCWVNTTLCHWIGGAWTRQCPCLTRKGSTVRPARCMGRPVITSPDGSQASTTGPVQIRPAGGAPDAYMRPTGATGAEVVEGRGGSGTQKCGYQNWPNQMFPTLRYSPRWSL